MCRVGESSGWVGWRRLMREGCGAGGFGCAGRGGGEGHDWIGRRRLMMLRAVVVRGEEGGGGSDGAGRRRLMREGCGAERALVARGGEGGAGVAIGPGGGG